MNAITPFLIPDHYRSTFATLAVFRNEVCKITHTYDDVEDGHVITVMRSGRCDKDGSLLRFRYKVDAKAAPYWFSMLVNAAMRTAPRFIPAEW